MPEYTGIIGTKGKTYAEQKSDMLRQMGYKVKASIFNGMTEIQIDNKARTIMGI